MNEKILCFGDSNTFGYDPRGYFGGRYDHPWPELLAQKLGCTVINQGENGRQIPAGNVVFPANAALLIVMLGTNDLLQGIAPETVGDRMERFLRSVNTKNILLIAPPPMKLGQWVPDPKLIADSIALADHYRRLSARLDVGFADAGCWDIPIAYDGVHLTEAGHSAFAENLCRELGRQLE